MNSKAIEAAREAYNEWGSIRDAIEAAAPIIRAEVEREVVEWLVGYSKKDGVYPEVGMALRLAALRIDCGAHRKQPMDEGEQP